MKRILVIKLSAFGDMIHALVPFHHLREHHKNDALHLLTTPQFQKIGEESGCFDEVIALPRLQYQQISQLWRLRALLKSYDMVYDLQCVDRTDFYFQLCRPSPPQWMGTARGCPFPSRKKDVYAIHPLVRYARQFDALNIAYDTDIAIRHLAAPCPEKPDSPYVVLVPGASMAHGGRKLWPQQKYARLAQWLYEECDLLPVIAGAGEQQFEIISQLCPAAIDLVGKTSWRQLIDLGQNARLSIGNDTGPMIVLHRAGSPALTLYNGSLCDYQGGSYGKNSHNLIASDFTDLSVTHVQNKVQEILRA